ncbi:hypothetical protein RP20_CCG017751 [Aedes albopictus]|nr:hypothetical protein RP20_CCG017751 [Aedes albopictus]
MPPCRYKGHPDHTIRRAWMFFRFLGRRMFRKLGGVPLRATCGTPVGAFVVSGIQKPNRPDQAWHTGESSSGPGLTRRGNRTICRNPLTRRHSCTPGLSNTGRPGQTWHAGESLNLPESTKAPTGPFGARRGYHVDRGTHGPSGPDLARRGSHNSKHTRAVRARLGTPDFTTRSHCDSQNGGNKKILLLSLR